MKLRILKTHNASRDGMRTEELLVDTIVDFPCLHSREVELVAMITRAGLAVEVTEEEAADFLADLAEDLERAAAKKPLVTRRGIRKPALPTPPAPPSPPLAPAPQVAQQIAADLTPAPTPETAPAAPSTTTKGK